MEISAVKSSNQQINMEGKLIKLGNLSAKENNAIESFMSSVVNGITNREIIAQKPYDVYVSRSMSKKNCLQIFGKYEECCDEYGFPLLKLFYNRKSFKPDLNQFRNALNRFDEEKLNGEGYSNELDRNILYNMRKYNRRPADGYGFLEKRLIAIRDKCGDLTADIISSILM